MLLLNGVRKIAPEENCHAVGVRVWVRFRVRVRAGEPIFLGGNCPRTLLNR